MKIEKKNYNSFQNILQLYKESWGYNRRILLFSLVSIVTGVIAPVFGIYLPKVAVDLLSQRADAGRIAWVLGGFVSGLLLLQGAKAYFGTSCYYYYNEMRKYFMRKIFLHSLNTSYAFEESSDCHQRYREAIVAVSWGDGSGPSRLFRETPELIVYICCFVLYSRILSTLHMGVVILLLISALIVYVFRRKEAVCYDRTMEEYARSGRQLGYTMGVCENVRSGKDIRVYDMGSWLAGLIQLLQGRQKKVLMERSNQEYKTQVVGCILNFLRDGLAYVYLIYETYSGNISMGDFVLYFGAITGFSNWVIQIIWKIGSIKTGNIQYNYIRTFLEIPIEEEKSEEDLPDVSEGVEISFEHVSFRYPEEAADTIHDVSFCIHRGERVAVVGLNGAGKTTLVKLMTGLYEPTSGVIRINGVDMTRLCRKDVYGLYSAVFQDIMLLPFRLDENIALQKKEEIDAKRVDEVIKLAGLQEELQKRGITQDSYMTKTLTEEGVNLSGGQQQKLLLARALYKDGPVLVLDEPTAALDPIAEKEIYEKYEELCEGKTAVFISHRLASTQFSHRIFFMKAGRIAECGSHEELLLAGGEYAHMFNVQSHYYNLSGQKGGKNL